MSAPPSGAGSTKARLRAGGPRLSVGMLTADLLRLGDELEVIVDAGAEIVHVDVMDGVFCPMLTVGTPVVQAMRTPMLKDVHLMVDDPLSKVEAFVAAGADMVTFHVEGVRQPHRPLRVLAGLENANDPARGVLRGVALAPSTSTGVLEPLIDELDYVLILAIDPGWGGQSLLSSTRDRVARVREMIAQGDHDVLVGIDGGVTRDNIDDVLAMGADVVVTGSAIFDGHDVAANARFMLARAVGAAGAAGAAESAARAVPGSAA